VLYFIDGTSELDIGTCSNKGRAASIYRHVAAAVAVQLLSQVNELVELFTRMSKSLAALATAKITFIGRQAPIFRSQIPRKKRTREMQLARMRVVQLQSGHFYLTERSGSVCAYTLSECRFYA